MIGNAGRTCEISIMVDDEYRAGLLMKLIQEAQEAADAAPGELVTELADLLEVVDAAISAHGRSCEAVEEERLRLRLERGGFERRIRELWTE